MPLYTLFRVSFDRDRNSSTSERTSVNLEEVQSRKVFQNWLVYLFPLVFLFQVWSWMSLSTISSPLSSSWTMWSLNIRTCSIFDVNGMLPGNINPNQRRWSESPIFSSISPHTTGKWQRASIGKWLSLGVKAPLNWIWRASWCNKSPYILTSALKIQCTRERKLQSFGILPVMFTALVGILRPNLDRMRLGQSTQGWGVSVFVFKFGVATSKMTWNSVRVSPPCHERVCSTFKWNKQEQEEEDADSRGGKALEQIELALNGSSFGTLSLELIVGSNKHLYGIDETIPYLLFRNWRGVSNDPKLTFSGPICFHRKSKICF